MCGEKVLCKNKFLDMFQSNITILGIKLFTHVSNIFSLPSGPA